MRRIFCFFAGLVIFFSAAQVQAVPGDISGELSMTRSLLPGFVQLLRPELFDPTQTDMSLPKFDMGEGTITIGGFRNIEIGAGAWLEDIISFKGKPISIKPGCITVDDIFTGPFHTVESPARWIESSSSIMVDTSADYSVNFEAVNDTPIPGAAVIFLFGLACLSLRRRF